MRAIDNYPHDPITMSINGIISLDTMSYVEEEVKKLNLGTLNTIQAKKIIAPNDPHFTFHVTRHTCASELANEDNQNLKLIAEYLGHRSLNTTTKYVHASHGAKKKLLQKRMRGAA